MVWSYRYGSFVVVLLQVVSKEDLREATVLHQRRCWWFWCCFCVSAQDTFDRSLLGNDLIEGFVLAVDALQPAVAFAVRVDAISQPSADFFEGRGLPIRRVGREAFKFGVIRVEGNDLLRAVFVDGVANDLHEIENQYEVDLVPALGIGRGVNPFRRDEKFKRH